MSPIKIECIQKFQEENSLTDAQFCKLCGISTSVLRKIKNGQTNFRILSLFRIAKTMKVPIVTLFYD